MSALAVVREAVEALSASELRAILSEARALGGSAAEARGLRDALAKYPALAAALLMAQERCGALHTATPALLRAAGGGADDDAAAAGAGAAEPSAAAPRDAAFFARALALSDEAVAAEPADAREAVRAVRLAAAASAAQRAALPPSEREAVERARAELVAAGVAVVPD
jgi:hypothetical protein